VLGTTQAHQTESIRVYQLLGRLLKSRGGNFSLFPLPEEYRARFIWTILLFIQMWTYMTKREVSGHYC
jgi:hypothetical protein